MLATPKRNELLMPKILAFMSLLVLAWNVFANELINPNLDANPDGTLNGWTPYGNAKYTLDTTTIHTGKTSVKGVSVKDGQAFGLKQVVEYENPNKLPIIFTGWSKAENVKGTQDYNIYLDIFYADGTNDWAKTAFWSPGTHDWEYASNCFIPKKPVAKIEYFVLLRRLDGTAWFDDFTLLRQVPDVQMQRLQIQSTAPQSKHGIAITTRLFNPKASASVKLLDATGKLLAETKKQGEHFSWSPALDIPAARIDFTVSCNGKQKTYTQTIPEHISSPNLKCPVKTPFQVWTADSMTNVSPLTYPRENEPANAHIELAKAEYESTQILVTAGKDELKTVTVQLPQLRKDDNTPLAGTIRWERVGYVPRIKPYSTHPNGYPDNEYWLPDPLLPPRPFTVKPCATQGVWITVHANRNAQPGTYKGNVLLTIDGATVQVPLAVTVFDFQLPETFSMPTAFCIMDGFLFRTYPDGDKNKTRRYAWDMMLDHRLNPDDISRTDFPNIDDLIHAKKRGMNRFNILNLVPQKSPSSLWVCYASKETYTPDFIDSLMKRLEPYVQELRKHDLTQFAYVYGFDERGEEYYPAINTIRERVHKQFPDIAFMTTSMMYKDLVKNPERTDCYGNDWYCPLTQYFKPELTAKLQAKGHQVWWYTCCGPKYPYANFASIEYPFIEGRLIAWQTFQYNADGLLYWHVNYWKDSKRFDESTCFQADFKLPSVWGMSGDGVFIYPGQDRILPSIRLANLRDGSEDYDYLKLLGKKSLHYCQQLTKSMTEYTRNPQDIRTARRNIAKQLE